jgi:hypothetical protein
MGLGTNNVTLTTVGAFVPTLWSDEVVASYKSNIVMAQLVRRLNHRGKKGNSITIPNPSRGTANAKVAGSQVTLIAGDSDTGISVSINKQYEYSRFIEDIVEVQALASVRRFYTDDGGYAIAKQVDKDLIYVAAFEGNNAAGSTEAAIGADGNITSALANAFIGDFSTAWVNTAGSTNATDLSDIGLRRLVQKLDAVDAPMAGRYLCISPNTKADMLGWARFTEQAFVGEKGSKNSLRNGLVGDVYGVEVYVTNQTGSVDNSNGSGNTAGNLLLGFQRDGLLLVEQMGVRTQTQYKQEWLADLFTADMIYGVACLRSSSVYPIVVPTSFTDG